MFLPARFTSDIKPIIKRQKEDKLNNSKTDKKSIVTKKI